MIAAVTMVRDEADILPHTLGQMLSQVDHVYVADNGSTDGTLDILHGMLAKGHALTLSLDTEVGYYQSEKMSRLAARARQDGAEWVVPFDADEFWTADERIADALSALPTETLIAQASVFDHVACGEVPSPWRRAERLPLRKVAVRALKGMTIHQGNHGASFPNVEHPLTVTDLLEIHHYPIRSQAQFIRKARNGAAAYAATDLPEEVGKHWRDWGKLTDEQLRDVYHRYYHTRDGKGLIHDARGDTASVL